MHNETHDMQPQSPQNRVYEPPFIQHQGSGYVPNLEYLDIQNPVRALYGDGVATRTVQVYILKNGGYDQSIIAADIADVRYTLHTKSDGVIVEILSSDVVDADLYYLKHCTASNGAIPAMVNYTPVGEPVDIEITTPQIKYVAGIDGRVRIAYSPDVAPTVPSNLYDTYGEAKRVAQLYMINAVMHQHATHELYTKRLSESLSELDDDTIYLTVYLRAPDSGELIGWSKDLGARTVARINSAIYDDMPTDKLTFPCGDSTYVKLSDAEGGVMMSEYIKVLSSKYPGTTYADACRGPGMPTW